MVVVDAVAGVDGESGSEERLQILVFLRVAVVAVPLDHAVCAV